LLSKVAEPPAGTDREAALVFSQGTSAFW